MIYLMPSQSNAIVSQFELSDDLLLIVQNSTARFAKLEYIQSWAMTTLETTTVPKSLDHLNRLPSAPFSFTLGEISY
jgi:hypothetical protein